MRGCRALWCIPLFGGATALQIDTSHAATASRATPQFTQYKDSNCIGHSGNNVDLENWVGVDSPEDCETKCASLGDICGSYVWCNASAAFGDYKVHMECRDGTNECWAKKSGALFDDSVRIEDCLIGEAGEHKGHVAGVRVATTPAPTPPPATTLAPTPERDCSMIHGPLDTDIPGAGYQRLRDVNFSTCRQACCDDENCKAFQWSASDTYQQDNCALHDNQKDTGSQYLSFQLWKMPVVEEEPKATSHRSSDSSKYSQACQRPTNWCANLGDQYDDSTDCDQDGVADLHCVSASGEEGVIGIASGCKDTWPSGSCRKVRQPGERCYRPSAWCTDPGASFDDSNDCDGDGIPDLVCVDAAHHTGVISSTTNCTDTWPTGVCDQGSQLESKGVDTEEQLAGRFHNMLKLHNMYRCMHDVMPLTWNGKLAEAAQAWADNLNGSHLEHDPKHDYAGFHWVGENMAKGGQNVLSVAVSVWYGDIKHTPLSNGATDRFASETGHYTQLVWKGTTMVGCGERSGIVVCKYGSGGNLNGQFQQNVFARSKTQEECA